MPKRLGLKHFIFLFIFIMGLLLCGCENTHTAFDSNAEIEPSDSLNPAQVSESVIDTPSVDGKKGTRSNPYHFGEEIAFSAIYNQEIINYALTFHELIVGYATRNLWENTTTIDENDMLLRASISITGTFDDAIPLEIYPTFLDKNFNEYSIEPAFMPTKTANGENDSIYNVYCGGTYDIIFRLHDRSEKRSFSYLKLDILDLIVDGERKYSGTLWFELPSEDELLSGEFFYTGRGFDTEPIVGSWSDCEVSSNCLVFYEDGTLKLVKDGYKYVGTWEYSEEDIEINSEDILNPRMYKATINNSDFMVAIVFDNPNFGDGEKDNLVVVGSSYETNSYIRDQ